MGDKNTPYIMFKDNACMELNTSGDGAVAAQANGFHVGNCEFNGWTVKGKSFIKEITYQDHQYSFPITIWNRSGLMNLEARDISCVTEGSCNINILI